ncbi:MAG TPA: PKD domain-containing protein, partial [Saprospiraceae bacterium]|nr:PKD domain-containing protein [Saprospiraceae bacterium]
MVLHSILIFSFSVKCQTPYNHPVSGNQIIYLAPQDYGLNYYYDDGGAIGNYSNNINNTSITFVVPDGYDLYYKVNSLKLTNDICQNDYLKVNQGFGDCGGTTTESIICESSPIPSNNAYPVCGNSIKFTFKSNSSITDAGWTIILIVRKRDIENAGITCQFGLYYDYPCRNSYSSQKINCGSSFSDFVPCYPSVNCDKNDKGDIDYYSPISGIYNLPEWIYEYDGIFKSNLCIDTDCPNLIQEMFLVHGCTVLQKGIKNGSNYCFTNVPQSEQYSKTYFIAEYNCITGGGGDIGFCNLNVTCPDPWNCATFPDIKCCDIINSSNSNGVKVAYQYTNCYNSPFGPNYSGPEKIYRFIATENGTVNISLSGLSDDLDLFVLDNCDINSTCGATNNLSHNSDNQDEFVSFNAVKGQDYYIVIDGWEGAISNYTLELECVPPVCNPCGECFLYTTTNGINTTQINCFNQYSVCGTTNPTNLSFKWFVDNVQVSTLENPVLSLNNGKIYQICQKVYNASSTLLLQCCWNVIAKNNCDSPPIASFKISNLNNNTIEFDPGTSSGGTEFTWRFGDATAPVIKTTSDKVSHTFAQSSTYTVCLYVSNENGISNYCTQVKTGSTNLGCQSKLKIPTFTTSLNNSDITINADPSQTSDIYEYSIKYGDGTNTITGSIWNSPYKHSYPAGKNSYQLSITYKMKYKDANGNCCIYYGCYNTTIKLGCCNTISNNCNAISIYFVTENQGLIYTLKDNTPGDLVENWEINDVLIPNSASNQLIYKFATDGVYKICSSYHDANGCLIKCCQNFCISNPLNCNEIFYTYVKGSGYKFSIDNSLNDYSDISWQVDAPFILNLGTGNNSNYLTLPIICQTYTISLRFYDKKCSGYRSCLLQFYVCDPFICNNIKYFYNAAQSSYQFSLDGDVSNASWSFDDNNEFIGSGTTVNYSVPVNCKSRTISVRYFDKFCSCWRICSLPFYFCDPNLCNNISYSYNSQISSYNFILNADATNAVWTFDDTGEEIGTGNSVSYKIPTSCKTRTISVRYYDKSCNCWRICNLNFYICNPFICNNIEFSYNSSISSYNFKLNVNASDAVWSFDDNNELIGTGSSVSYNGPFNCQSRTISVRYFDIFGNTWRICSIQFYVCDPYLCNTINYSFNNATSSYSFNLDGNVSNAVWKFDDTNLEIGTGNIVTYNGPINCKTRPISVSYFDKTCNCWKICNIKFYICNPFDCTGIKYYYGNDLKYHFSIEGDVSDAVWSIEETKEEIGTGKTLSYDGPLNCTTRTISVRYLDQFCNCWRLCSYKIYLCPPNDCNGDIIYANLGSGKVELKSNNINAQNISWYTLSDNKLLGQGSLINASFTQGNTVTICMYFFDPVSNSFQVCCRDVMVAPTVSFEPEIGNLFKIVPNPTNSQFRIESDYKSEILAIEIFDLTGKKMYATDKYILGNMIKLDVPSGIYQLRVKLKEKSLNLKL